MTALQPTLFPLLAPTCGPGSRKRSRQAGRRAPPPEAPRHIAYLRLSQPKAGARRGRPRLWLEGKRLRDAGFDPGCQYAITYDAGAGTVTLNLVGSGHARKVQRRRRNGEFSPVVDIQTEDLTHIAASCAGDSAPRFQASFYIGRVVIVLHPDDAEYLSPASAAAATSISTGSVFHGAGFMDAALHAGLAETGVHGHMRFAVEQEARYLDASFRANPELWSAGSTAVLADIDDVPPDSLPRVHLLTCGIPCLGASNQGRTARALTRPEDHPDVGHLIMTTMAVIRTLRPMIGVIECVPEYASTVGWQMATSCLGRWGYEIECAFLAGPEFGALEMRRRMVAVARRPIVNAILGGINRPPYAPVPQTVSSLLDPVKPDAACWRPYEHACIKAARDLAGGKNLRMPVYSGSETQVRSLIKGYGDGTKAWQPFLAHPETPGLYRKFSPAENARLKGVPAEKVAGMTVHTAHEILGQGVVWPIFKSLGAAIGRAIRALGVLPDLGDGRQIATG